MVSDAAENVGQISLRVDPVHPAGFDDGVHAGGSLSASIGPAKQIILPSENRRPHGALGGIVAHLQPAVADVAGQPPPQRQRIADRLGERALAADPGQRGLEKPLQLIQPWLSMLLTGGGTPIRWLSMDVRLDG